MKPTHITVIFGDHSALTHVGIGPQFRRVTLELTDEQRARLSYQVECEEIDRVILETVTPDRKD